MIRSGNVYLSNDDDDSGFPYRTWSAKKEALRFLELREIGLLSRLKNPRLVKATVYIETEED